MKEKNIDEGRRQERNDFSLNSNGHVHCINTWFKGTATTYKASLILRAPSLKYTTLFRRTSERILRTLTNSTLFQIRQHYRKVLAFQSLYLDVCTWQALRHQTQTDEENHGSVRADRLALGKDYSKCVFTSVSWSYSPLNILRATKQSRFIWRPIYNLYGRENICASNVVDNFFENKKCLKCRRLHEGKVKDKRTYFLTLD